MRRKCWAWRKTRAACLRVCQQGFVQRAPRQSDGAERQRGLGNGVAMDEPQRGHRRRIERRQIHPERADGVDRLGTDEIASRLYISEHTVRSHVKSLLRKLDVSSRREALERLAVARR